ncbi:hypothetical protein F4604DRAFT_1673414 [Suillus subluteus]|nr:hypothetical protein F4604DRAFT_1673414 [Suillus subluteus]
MTFLYSLLVYLHLWALLFLSLAVLHFSYLPSGRLRCRTSSYFAKSLATWRVYLGLYKFEGQVVPYMVVVKVSKPTERLKPGNKGKCDSQILLMYYLNRVHFNVPIIRKSPRQRQVYQHFSTAWSPMVTSDHLGSRGLALWDAYFNVTVFLLVPSLNATTTT